MWIMMFTMRGKPLNWLVVPGAQVYTNWETVVERVNFNNLHSENYTYAAFAVSGPMEKP